MTEKSHRWRGGLDVTLGRRRREVASPDAESDAPQLRHSSGSVLTGFNAFSPRDLAAMAWSTVKAMASALGLVRR